MVTGRGLLKEVELQQWEGRRRGGGRSGAAARSKAEVTSWAMTQGD